MIRFTDVHQHFLYGIDDGPQDADAMFAMLDRAYDESIRRIIATPHVMPGLEPYRRDRVLCALKEAARYCASRDYGIRLYEGGEIYYTDATARLLDAGDIPTMAGTAYVLVEFSTDVTYKQMYDAAYTLLGHGYLPIIAHVERYRCLTRHLKNAYRLKEELEVFYQMNAETVADGGYFLDRRFVRSMIRDRQIDVVGTDAHNITSRPARMREAYAALKKYGDVKYARWLTHGGLIFYKEKETEVRRV